MADLKKAPSNLINALIYIALGVLLCIFRGEGLLKWAMIIGGSVVIILGVVDILKEEYMSGAISAVIGIAIIVLGLTVIKIVLLVFGILLALKGIAALIAAIKSKSVVDIVFASITIAATKGLLSENAAIRRRRLVLVS